MKTWKALLEEGIFSAVVVGQDVMPRFKAEFPNEFGVTQDFRLSYLPAEHGRRLLEDPIRIGGLGGESRYRGRAIERALELTSGSAYYAQMLGDRLVRYMNGHRAMYVTEADIEHVAGAMTSGPEALLLDKFDNMTTAGDAATTAFSQEETLGVLAALARGSRAGLCSKQVLIEEELAKLDPILDDLVAREVIYQPRPGYYQIHVGLFRRWLQAHYGEPS
jgi:hypothetical protein